MTITLIEPQSEPIYLRDLKDFLKLDLSDSSSDGDLLAFAVAAREWVENYLRKKIVIRTVRSLWDSFPVACYRGSGWARSAEIALPYFPARSIVAVNAVGADGNMAVVDPSIYDADLQSQPARLAPKWGRFWPIIATPRASSVAIDYVTGVGDVRTMSTTAGQAAVTGSGFVSTDVGRLVTVAGAGAAGATLRTRILAVSTGSAATLADVATTAVTNSIALIDIPAVYQVAVVMLAAYWFENKVSQGDVPQYIKTLLYSSRNLY